MKKAITLLLSLILLIAFSALLTACDGGTGPQGANGADGADGVSIIKTEVIDGYLWITYSNAPETPVNVGKVSSDAALHDGSEGLEFYPLSDGTYAVGMGNAIYLEEIVFPSTYNGKPVTRIVSSQSVFAVPNDYRTEIKKITIPDSIVAIGDYAFEFCVSITEIEIPNTVTQIGEKCFYGCSQLKNIVLPNGITEIPAYAFGNCENLETISFSSNLEKIGGYAFASCSKLTSISFGSQMKYIGEGAFGGCHALSKVSVDSLGTWLQIEFETGTMFIYSDSHSNPLFYAHDLYINNEKLTELIIPSGTTKINANAFSGCSIQSVTIPASITTVGDYAFYACENLSAVKISDLSAWCKLSFAFYNDYNATYVSNPLYYAHNLYLNNQLITQLVIPDDVTKINEFVFAGANFTSVVMSNNVDEICRGAFYVCDNLDRVYFEGNGMEWSSITKGNANVKLTGATLYTYSAESPTTGGNYWCYDNGIIKIWN